MQILRVFLHKHYCTLKVQRLGKLKSTLSKVWNLLFRAATRKASEYFEMTLMGWWKKVAATSRDAINFWCLLLKETWCFARKVMYNPVVSSWKPWKYFLGNRSMFHKTSLPSYPASKYRILIISYSWCYIHLIVYSVYPIFFYFWPCAHFQIQWTRFLGQTTLQQTGVSIWPTKALLRENPSKLPYICKKMGSI